ncbi:MAG TPA: hypothetical protein VGN39_11880 [Terriglobales bacterium]|jgi:hypothetical protein|nr:hypothetical protein [Terriglobales bacterium]
MAGHKGPGLSPDAELPWTLSRIAKFPRLRALFWDNNYLYASRCYDLLRAKMDENSIEWNRIARYNPPLWRGASSSFRLASRLFRDGFHALAKLPSGHLVAAVPGAVIALKPGDLEFRVSYQISRGTRPLHIATTPEGHLYWGEYFDNPERAEVHVYASTDCGDSWQVAYTFPKGAIRHVHNIVYDPWQNCLWILTGDNGNECRILRASCEFADVETVLSGNQQARAVAAVPSEQGLYFSSDTPLEKNFIYRLNRDCSLATLAELNSSSIYGCRAGNTIFFSTMVEPSTVNLDRVASVYGSHDRNDWPRKLEWKKDRWPMRFFQYGNAVLPDGRNTTDMLAVSTIAVQPGDGETSIWRIVIG